MGAGVGGFAVLGVLLFFLVESKTVFEVKEDVDKGVQNFKLVVFLLGVHMALN